MKRAAIILTLLCGVGACRGGDAFYVWQQRWSPAVVAAVTNEPATEIYFLAAVIAARGETTTTPVPWPQLAGSPHRYVPVIRVPLNAFGRAGELSRVATELSGFNEIQIDLDCPESRLAEYAERLKELRAGIPQKRLSITALPAHLGNRAFRDVAAAVDEYTLQVHGLDVPKTINDPAELMNLRTAEKAIDRAEKLGRPYRVALPCYAYELNFDPDTGAFLFLTAEGPAHRRNTVKRRIAADPADLLQLQRRARDVIWFRLPVAGDRLCLPRAALGAIQSGRAPQTNMELITERVSETTIELSLRNGNIIHAASAELSLDWAIPAGSCDLYHGIDAAARTPGQLPTHLTVSLPPPGQSTKIGWFSSVTPPTINLELK